MPEKNLLQIMPQGAGFEPADLVLLGTSDARNPWRRSLIVTLDELSAESDREIRVFDPVIKHRPWDPVIDGPREEYQKDNAHYCVCYLGTKGDGELSTYTAHEIPDLLMRRGSDTTAVILDPRDLDEQAQKQLRAIRQSITTSFPGLTIVENVGESLEWITARLGLGEALGKVALKYLADAINNGHILSPAVISVNQAELIAEEKARREAQPLLGKIDKAIQKLCSMEAFYIRGLGVTAFTSPDEKNVIRYIEKVYRAAGWDVRSNADGDLVLSRPPGRPMSNASIGVDITAAQDSRKRRLFQPPRFIRNRN